MFDAIDKTTHVEIIDNPDVREFLSNVNIMVLRKFFLHL